MKTKGIIYDTGMDFKIYNTKRRVTNNQIKKEFEIIKNELNCNAIGFHGSDVNDMINASKMALETGLKVWLFPRFVDKDSRQTVELLLECAEKAEILRKEYEDIVLGIGDELSVNCAAMFSGENYVQRVRRLSSYIRFKDIYINIMGKNLPKWFLRDKSKDNIMKKHFSEFSNKNKIKEMSAIGKEIEKYLKGKQKVLDKLVSDLVKASRKNFKGLITYSAGWWEDIDWNVFDIVGVGLYMEAGNWFTYDRFFRELKTYGKPVVATEFGSATFKHASMYGGGAWQVFNKHEVERSEREQANHIKRQFELLKRAKVEGCFLYNFVDGTRIHVKKPKSYKEDDDTGGYGIMKVLPDGTVKPKKAFHALRKCYSK